LFALVALAFAAGCSTYRDDLARSQRAFEENQHETALAVLRILEPDTSHLNEEEQAHYAYLRGMTDFRIGYKADARHWLAVAKAMDAKTPGLLPEDWRTRTDQSLAQLDKQVWSGGIESLTVVPPEQARAEAEKRRAKKKKAPVVTPRSEEDEEEEAAPKPAPKKKPAASDDDDE
jgi:hypothetical protein